MICTLFLYVSLLEDVEFVLLRASRTQTGVTPEQKIVKIVVIFETLKLSYTTACARNNTIASKAICIIAREYSPDIIRHKKKKMFRLT